MNYLMFALASMGLTHILVESKMAKPIRWCYDELIKMSPKIIQDWLGGLFDCHQCCGFWSGLVMGGIFFDGWPVLAAGFAGSFLSSCSAMVLEICAYLRDWLMSNISVEVSQDE